MIENVVLYHPPTRKGSINFEILGLGMSAIGEFTVVDPALGIEASTTVEGYTVDGLECRRAEVTRVGFPWQLSDFQWVAGCIADALDLRKPV